MIRYLLLKEEPCPEMVRKGDKPHVHWCDDCDGTGIIRTEIDLRQALVELGQVSDGK